jgi:hypothetical protein
MASHHRRCLPFYLALLLTFLLPPLASSLWQNCGNSNNFTRNSTYQANIQALSATLPKNASTSSKLFALATVGTLPDIVYALALCRGDVNASDCGDCVSKGFVEAQQLCPYNRDATIYDDPCYLRFSNQNFLSDTTGGDNGGALLLMNAQNVTAPVKVFDAAVAALMNAIADYAAQTSIRFATGEKGFETVDKDNPKIYGLAQCRPDMAPSDCRSCLAGIIGSIPKYFGGSQGARILGLQCNFRYEQYPFFNGASLLQLPAPSLGAAPAPAPVNATPASTPPPQGGKPILFARFIIL